MPVKPDPITETTDRLADALKGKRNMSGGIFRDAAGKNSPVIGDVKPVADVINSGGLSTSGQDQVWKRYQGRTDRTHDVHRKSGDGGEQITIEPKKTALEPLGYII